MENARQRLAGLALTAGLFAMSACSGTPGPNLTLASRADCPQMPPDIEAEINNFARLPEPGEDKSEFAKRLILSEAEKTQKLKRSVELYHQCKGEPRRETDGKVKEKKNRRIS